MTMTAIPALDRTSATFKADVDTFFTSRIPTFVTEANALQADVVAKQLLAAGSATSASTDAGTATAKADEAATSATNALEQAGLAAASANSAINSPGTSATSATSLTIGSGSKTLTIQTGKALVVGQFLMCANPSAPVNYMVGQITAYNSGTGALTLNVTSSGGAGTYASWNLALTPAGSGASNGGADVTTSAADITLLASSGRMQAVTMTTPGKSIFLPDATSLSTGGAIFILTNKGANSFYARKPSGIGVVKVPPNTSALLYLSDNTASDGAWSAGLLTQSTALALGTILTVNAVDSLPQKSITALTQTTALVTWRESNTLKACVLVVNNLAVSQPGNVLTISASVGANCISALNSTQALVFFGSTTGTSSSAAVLSVSGTTVSIGSICTVHATKGSYLSLAVLSPTVVVATQNGTGDVPKGFVLTISGTTVSPGTEQAVFGTFTSNILAYPLDATHAVFVYGLAGIYAAVLTVTGSTIAVGSFTQLISTYVNIRGISTFNSGQTVAVLHMGVSSYATVTTGNISGTTVAPGTSLQLAADAMSSDGAMASVSQTQAVISYQNATVLKAALVSFGDGGLSSTVPMAMNAVVSATPSLCPLSNTRALEVYAGTSNYLQAVVVEVL